MTIDIYLHCIRVARLIERPSYLYVFQLPSNCNKFVEAGGLAVLQQLSESKQLKRKILHSIATILSNLAFHENLRHSLISSGAAVTYHFRYCGISV